MEEWKEIKDFKGYYISNYGNVKSIDRTICRTDGRIIKYKGKQKRLFNNPNGYLETTLSIHHKNYSVYPHKLVAEYFLEKPKTNEKLIVNHKDGNKHNNKYTNLEWTTYSENITHSYKILNQNKPKSNGYANPIIVKDINKQYIYYDSVKNAANNCNLSKTQIFRILDTGKADLKGNIYYTFKWNLYNKIQNKNDVFLRKHGISKQVLLIKNNKIVKIFNSIKETGKYFNKSEYIIAKLIRRGNYIDGKLILKFISVEDIEMILNFYQSK